VNKNTKIIIFISKITAIKLFIRNFGTKIAFGSQLNYFFMKNFYIAILICLSFIQLQAQKVDYDNTSKWFMGFNIGGTWSTTDVKNQTSTGWGLVLGKSFNYNYGSVISFDLRGRYLRGMWYGQDIDTTSLLNYTGSALQEYKDQYGFTVNNFQSDVHHVALELALHLNSVRERTGWDPYIFGGLGLTFKQTFGDLLDQNNNSTLYDYSSMLANGSLQPQLSSALDKIYDSPLDGSTNEYQAYFTPSLGFGLGYQIGKRVSLGLEHKTTFTRGDDFDGFESETPRLKNDLYHYTSLYLNFRFRTRGNGNTTAPTDGTNSTGNINNFNTNCPPPVITFNVQNNQVVNFAQYRLDASVTELQNAQNVTIYNNLNQVVPSNYNTLTKRVTADLVLVEGVNTITIKAQNNCGTDTKTFTITYNPCISAKITFTNPIQGTTVRNTNFTVNAIITNVANAAGIKFFENNVQVNGFSFDPISGLLTSNVTLAPGLNTFKIEATNLCGTITSTASVTFDNCVSPTVQLINPSSTGTTTNTAAITIQAFLKNVLSNQSVSVTQNGIAVTNFTFNNGQLVFPTTLANGINTFVITANSSCGNASETFTINYQNCAAPLVTLNNPTNNSTVNVASLVFKSRIDNIAAKQNVSLKLNGIDINNFTFNTVTKLVQSTLQLQPGMNVISIGAINNCGSDIETIYVNYDNCVAPNVLIANTNLAVTNPAFVLNATIQNMVDAQGLLLTQNGNPVNFNYFNSQLTSALTLVPGNNTFVLTATKSCGTSTKSVVINYNNCIAPSVFILNPTASGSVVNASTLAFKASVTNITNAQQIVLKQNNQVIPFNYNNGFIEANATLSNGVNNFQVTVTNACGTDTKTTAISFVNCTPPAISILNPVMNNTTINFAQFQFKAAISGSTNAQAVGLKVNGQDVTFNLSNAILTANLNLIPGVNSIIVSASNSCGTVIETSTITYDNCVPPTIQLTGIQNTTQTVTNPNFALAAVMAGINLPSNISFTQNGLGKSFNFANSNFSANLQLVEGLNTITLSATNSCGVAIKTLNITLNTCVPPSVAFVNPSVSGSSVATAAYVFKANVQNITTAQGISLKQNGATISNFSFVNGQISANVTLQAGLNTFTILATNACGIATETTSITFDNCIPPTVSFTNPNNSGITVNRPSFNLTAAIQNVNASGIILTQNGTPITNFGFTNGQLSHAVQLQNGLNTFIITATNSCGTATQTITVNYSSCVTPVVAISNPSNGATAISTAGYNFTANVQNITSAQGISLKLNGNTVSNFTFNNGNIQANVTLAAGLNTFVLTATNACGTVTETRTITYNNCVPPTAVINTPSSNGTTVSSAGYNFSANVQNITSAQGIALKLNGITISNFTFVNGNVQASVTLQAGLNTFILTATNACGIVTETRTVTYTCQLPTIVFNPSISRGSSFTYFFSATVSNVPSQQGINFTLNNAPVTDYTYQSGNIQTTLNLQNGANTIRITATNACGTATRDTVINFGSCDAPEINNTTSPASGSVTQNTSLNVSAVIQNYTQETNITVKVNGNAVTNYSNINGIISGTLPLQNGTTTVEITATNACGTDSDVYSITRCKPTSITLIDPSTRNTTVTSPNHVIQFNLFNADNQTVVNISQNGTPNNNFSLNGQLVAGNIQLVPGVNTFQLTVSNTCNTLNETIIINYVAETPTNDGNTSPGSPTNNNSEKPTTDGEITNPEQSPNDTNGQTDATGTNTNNGHGNNADGVDSSNPGQGSGGPNGQVDSNGGVDDENGNGNGGNGNNSNQQGINPPTNNAGSNNKTTNQPSQVGKPNNTVVTPTNTDATPKKPTPAPTVNKPNTTTAPKNPTTPPTVKKPAPTTTAPKKPAPTTAPTVTKPTTGDVKTEPKVESPKPTEPKKEEIKDPKKEGIKGETPPKPKVETKPQTKGGGR
jgi:hypothetical protein